MEDGIREEVWSTGGIIYQRRQAWAPGCDHGARYLEEQDASLVFVHGGLDVVQRPGSRSISFASVSFSKMTPPLPPSSQFTAVLLLLKSFTHKRRRCQRDKQKQRHATIRGAIMTSCHSSVAPAPDTLSAAETATVEPNLVAATRALTLEDDIASSP
ncbi:hypothetical protein OPV22_007387 [Ensete ventricosum]|uniref:Uncharacterized protein n=1 Tax=Ensete ventricosum TaxID=4639 RepID=A0AAV8Q8G3_ENSVE|nr:hypothetical protein OPV22_007387 [Ensete ventricosum]